MTQKMKALIGAAAFVLMLAGAVFAYNALRGQVNPEIVLSEQQGDISAQAQEAAEASEKTKSPDFSIEDANGNTVRLSDMEGRPVVLNFWASWCPPCKAEMPDFDTVYQELGEDVAFLMVNLTDGQRETKQTARAFTAQKTFSFPIYFDTKQEAANAYGIRSIPTTVFIDSEGYIVTGAEGQLDEKTLRYGISLIQTGGTTGDTDPQYQTISAEEAHQMMQETEEFILLDVRTDEEYQERHISGAILIPDYEITERAETELPEKDKPILVYCRTGRRSAEAAQALADMGYTKVYDFGGIVDWPYETE